MALFLSEAEVLDACRILFGHQIALSRDFLVYLQPGGAKSAFRQKAKETHPDLYRGEDPSVLKRQADSFREVTKAYKLVSDFLREREKYPGSSFRFVPHPRRPPSARGDGTAGYRQRPSPFIPSRTLEIGLFLYYRQVIPFRVLAEALVWQRRQRPCIGQIARRWNWIDDEGLARVSRSRIPFSRFGEKAVHLGLLTSAQVRTLLFYQRSRQQRLGQFFIDRGLLSPEEMDHFVEELRRHNARVFDRTGG